MIASLPMYDRPETAAANDRFWREIRHALGFGPKQLTRADDRWQLWRDPDLVFSQTCGLPFRQSLHEIVTLIGTPDYGLPGMKHGYYYSEIIARRALKGDIQDFQGARLAINSADSQSGWAAIAAHANIAGVSFGSIEITGSHRASARIVAEGTADIAAIDAQTWRMMKRHDAFTADLCVIDRTAPTPGLPYICAPMQPADAIFEATATAIDGLSADDRDLLGLTGLVRIPTHEYLCIPVPQLPAMPE